jgi:hypothetical protein
MLVAMGRHGTPRGTRGGWRLLRLGGVCCLTRRGGHGLEQAAVRITEVQAHALAVDAGGATSLGVTAPYGIATRRAHGGYRGSSRCVDRNSLEADGGVDALVGTVGSQPG